MSESEIELLAMPDLLTMPDLLAAPPEHARQLEQEAANLDPIELAEFEKKSNDHYDVALKIKLSRPYAETLAIKINNYFINGYITHHSFCAPS